MARLLQGIALRKLAEVAKKGSNDQYQVTVLPERFLFF
jgi:hypothetical protein